MNESLPTPKTNARHEIDEAEAKRRLAELEPVVALGHLYSRVERGTLMSDGSFETNGDHVVQLQLAALAYVSKYHPELDHGRLTIYLLIHDIVEAVCGDTVSLGLDENGLVEKESRERAAMDEIANILGDFPVLVEYLHDYESLQNPEAQAGKAIDKLMPGYTHLEDRGLTLHHYGVDSSEKLYAATSASDARLEVYAEAFQDIIMMRRVQSRMIAQVAFRGATDSDT